MRLQPRVRPDAAADSRHLKGYERLVPEAAKAPVRIYLAEGLKKVLDIQLHQPSASTMRRCRINEFATWREGGAGWVKQGRAVVQDVAGNPSLHPHQRRLGSADDAESSLSLAGRALLDSEDSVGFAPTTFDNFPHARVANASKVAKMTEREHRTERRVDSDDLAARRKCSRQDRRVHTTSNFGLSAIVLRAPFHLLLRHPQDDECRLGRKTYATVGKTTPISVKRELYQGATEVCALDAGAVAPTWPRAETRLQLDLVTGALND